MILEKTVDLIKSIYKYHRIIPPKINRVVIGLGYTAVEVYALSFDPFLGLSYTLSSVIQNFNCSKIDFAGSLTEMKMEEILGWAYEPPSLKKIIGIATLNALSQHILEILNPYKMLKVDIIEFLKINKDTKLTFIGLIKPLIQEISKITESITIIENNIPKLPLFKKFTLKSHINELNEDELPTDILFCTGTSLINNTMEGILEKYKKIAKKIIVVGPTASMIPDILFDYGVDIVGGMIILNSESTLKVIQEGGGTRIFKQFGKKYWLKKE
ncbi:MAG: hypothetical protein EU535_06075 [Promethearchaeota archaeon]|nr:MAG: hypothetical protein EU535_06075 [Candidatus Lokiarchaeota archaeon]